MCLSRVSQFLKIVRGKGAGHAWFLCVPHPLAMSLYHHEGWCRGPRALEKKKQNKNPSLGNLISGKEISPPSLAFILQRTKLRPRKFHPLCQNHVAS